MRTKKLHTANKLTVVLTDFLEKREWVIGDRLTSIIDRADAEIERTEKAAVADVISRLERYLEEAEMWAANRAREKITKREQAKAVTEAKRIKKTLKALREL